MVFIGMIFQFDSTQGAGLIMFSDGEKKAFSTNDWVDTENTPTVGQKVSYERSHNRVQIKMASQTDQITTTPEDETSKDNALEAFTSIDEYCNHYIDMGFKLVKDVESDGSRTLSLRMFADGDPLEVIIKQSGSKISVTQKVNGKPVV